MLIVSKFVLNDIAAKLVESTHGLVNERGDRQVQGTIDDRRLEMAALTALQIAVGEPVWPDDRAINLPRRRSLPGPFREED